jgi:hypothetical protein
MGLGHALAVTGSCAFLQSHPAIANSICDASAQLQLQHTMYVVLSGCAIHQSPESMGALCGTCCFLLLPRCWFILEVNFLTSQLVWSDAEDQPASSKDSTSWVASGIGIAIMQCLNHLSVYI